MAQPTRISASTKPTAMNAFELMTPRPCNSQDPAPRAATMTPVNFCHSLGCSFNLSFMQSIEGRLEGAGQLLFRLGGALKQKVADDQIIHGGVHKTAIRVVR